ncbi:N-acetylmuramoyl-L-alanine amidase [uncultured Prevotella sp.]|uniref:N-acetylmuramoyl-L-alanine amidase family protein n=1 Tax=uncultured Prevotella sp. TaxID=159272 RepID=UPI00260AC519|nr:N-acetylmuramoyl-L-alanine amidase [uncultured Prevotella sp.]
MGKKIIFFLLILISFSAMAFSADKRFTLVIDAGHGGHDSGAKGAFSYEKDINLNVALAFGRYVERNCPDVKVVYTRKTDVFIPLHKRADIANKNKADVFISIHTNALPAGHIARGLETYTMGMRRSDEKLSAAKRENSVIMIEKDYKEHYEGYDPNSPESTIMFEFIHDRNMSKSVELAKYVQSSVCSTAGRQNKGVKQDVFLVLRETSMPACLIELGFITTPDEERFLNDKDNIDKMAKGIYQAFVKYKEKYNKGFTVPYNSPQDSTIDIPSIVPDKVNEPEKPKAKRQTRRRVETQRTEEEKPKEETIEKENKADVADEPSDKPVFKIQIFASSRTLRAGSSQFKGLENVGSYKEGDWVKYTYGSSTDYNEIYRLRKTILDKFPEAFIIAFKNGEKMNVNQAIREFKSK